MDRGAWWAAVHGVAKSQTLLSDFTFTFHFHALEKEMATHSSVLAWRIPGTGGAWWAAVYGVAQSRTRLKRLSGSGSRSCAWLCDLLNCSLPGSSDLLPLKIPLRSFPGKNTGVGCHALLQGIVSTQGPASPALAGGSFTTEPPGRPYQFIDRTSSGRQSLTLAPAQGIAVKTSLPTVTGVLLQL